jgi:Zn-finger nucleic acid-binding protein
LEWRVYSSTGRVYAAELRAPAAIHTVHGVVGAEPGDFLVVDLECDRVRYCPGNRFHDSYQVVDRPVPLKALADLSELVVTRVVESDGASAGETCVRCGKRRTRMEFEGVPTCLDCELKIKAEREETLECKHDGAAMRKEVIQNVIVDRCPECGGAWFDGGELEILGAALHRAADFGMPADLASRLLHGLVEREPE